MKILQIVICCILLSISALADKAILLADDRDALQARVDLVQQAKHEILAEYFSVWKDEQSVGGMALLIEAAQKGIKVKVILDALANTIPYEMFAALREKGKDKFGNQNLEVRVYNPYVFSIFKMTYRDHAKALIFDGQRIITGGRNIGDKYFGLHKTKNYHDLDILAEGQVASNARASFYKIWNSEAVAPPQLHQYSAEALDQYYCAYKEDFFDCEQRRQAALKVIEKVHNDMNSLMSSIGKIDLNGTQFVSLNTKKDWLAGVEDSVQTEFLVHNPEKFKSIKDDSLNDRFAEILLKAKSEVIMVSPYVIPTPRLINIFEQVLTKGVKIKIITNSLKSTDNLLAQAGYRKYKQSLIKMGLEIWEYAGPNTIHAKTTLIDDSVCLVGTSNLDPRSFMINRELAVVFKDTSNRFNTHLKKVIEIFRERSFLVGKSGVEYNSEIEYDGVSDLKIIGLNAINSILPLIENQL